MKMKSYKSCETANKGPVDPLQIILKSIYLPPSVQILPLVMNNSASLLAQASIVRHPLFTCQTSKAKEN